MADSIDDSVFLDLGKLLAESNRVICEVEEECKSVQVDLPLKQHGSKEDRTRSSWRPAVIVFVLLGAFAAVLCASYLHWSSRMESVVAIEVQKVNNAPPLEAIAPSEVDTSSGGEDLDGDCRETESEVLFQGCVLQVHLGPCGVAAKKKVQHALTSAVDSVTRLAKKHGPELTAMALGAASWAAFWGDDV